MKLIRSIFLLTISMIYLSANSGNIEKWTSAIKIKIVGDCGLVNDFAKVISTSDGKILAAGELLTRCTNNNKTQLLYLDKYGNKIWYKLIKIGEDTNVGSLIETKDKNFIFVGYHSKYSKDKGIIVLKIDRKGEILWNKTFDLKGHFASSEILKSSDGNFMIFGYGMLKESKGLYILKIDKDGNKLWDKSIKYKDPIVVTSVVKDKDDNFVIAGYKNINYFYLGGFVTKIDKSANVVWTMYLNQDDKDAVFSMDIADDGFILAGTRLLNKQNMDYTPLVIKISRDGKVVWRKILRKSKTIYSYSNIVSFKDGNSIIFGERMESIRMLKIDRDGKPIFEKTIYKSKERVEIYRVKKSKDGGIMIVGTKDVNDFINGYIMKIDRDGNIGKYKIINLDVKYDNCELWNNP